MHSHAVPSLTVLLVGLIALPACSAPKSTAGCFSSEAQGLEVCTTGPTVKGVDVSTYQGTVDWTKAKAAGIDFAFARVSDGTTNPDDQFAANWKGMKAAGILRGAYQYWRASEDPTAQAALVMSSLQAAGGIEAGDLPVVLDIETADGVSAAKIEANMKTWLAAVQASTGTYAARLHLGRNLPITATTFDTYALWVANYDAKCPAMPVGWTSWVFWQEADNGTVSGISTATDTDVFNGTLAQLQVLAASPSEDAGEGADSGSGSGSGSSSGSSSGSGTDAGTTPEAGANDAGAHPGSSSGGATPCGS